MRTFGVASTTTTKNNLRRAHTKTLFLGPEDRVETGYAFVHVPKNAGVAIKTAIKKFKLPIKPCFHSSVVKCVGKRKAIVVVRDPLSRFASAVHYALEFYSSKSPNIREIKRANLITVQDWVEAMINPSEKKKGKLIMREISNVGLKNKKPHDIDGRRVKFKYTYVPQIAWIGGLDKPIILRFEHLDEDWSRFLRANDFPSEAVLSERVTWGGKVSKTPIRSVSLTQDALNYLHQVYKRDFDLYHAVQ